MEQILLYTENDIYKPFPEPADAPILEDHNKNLIPLGVLNRDDMDILIALPLVDEEGFISKESYDEFDCSEFHMTYSLNGGLWRVDTDIDNLVATERDYSEAISSYEENKRFYKENKFLQYHAKSAPNPENKSDIFRYGMKPTTLGNWYCRLSDKITKTLNVVAGGNNYDSIVNIYDNDGNEFEYLGDVECFHYIKGITAYLMYYYEKKNSRVLVFTSYT